MESSNSISYTIQENTADCGISLQNDMLLNNSNKPLKTNGNSATKLILEELYNDIESIDIISSKDKEISNNVSDLSNDSSSLPHSSSLKIYKKSFTNTNTYLEAPERSIQQKNTQARGNNDSNVNTSSCSKTSLPTSSPNVEFQNENLSNNDIKSSSNLNKQKIPSSTNNFSSKLNSNEISKKFVEAKTSLILTRQSNVRSIKDNSNEDHELDDSSLGDEEFTDKEIHSLCAELADAEIIHEDGKPISIVLTNPRLIKVSADNSILSDSNDLIIETADNICPKNE